MAAMGLFTSEVGLVLGHQDGWNFLRAGATKSGDCLPILGPFATRNWPGGHRHHGLHHNSQEPSMTCPPHCKTGVDVWTHIFRHLQLPEPSFARFFLSTLNESWELKVESIGRGLCMYDLMRFNWPASSCATLNDFEWIIDMTSLNHGPWGHENMWAKLGK